MASILLSMEPPRPDRQSSRLPGYDYGSDGWYFVTICTKDKRCIFGNISDDQVLLIPVGRIVSEEWVRSAAIRTEIRLDEFVIMPNHFHAIVQIDGSGPEQEQRTRLARPSRSLSSLIAQFEAAVTTRARTMLNSPGGVIWQRGFFDRIVRDERELDAARDYIRANPVNWSTDPDR